jgi:hypothetical protein
MKEATEGTEIGATGGDLRYWMAKEALRQSELRLAAQPNSLQAMETRATSILTWSVSVGLALVALWSTGRAEAPAIAAFACTFAASAAAVWALWPRTWTVAGHQLSEMQSWTYATELEHLEAMATGNAEAAAANDRRMRAFGQALKVAWVLLAMAPAAALVTVAAARL